MTEYELLQSFRRSARRDDLVVFLVALFLFLLSLALLALLALLAFAL